VLCSSLLATTLDAGSAPLAVAGCLAVQGLGYGLFSSPNMAMLMNSVPPAQATMASALGAMSRSVGMIVGMLVTAVLVSLAYGHEPVAAHPLRFVGVLRTSFAVVAGLCAVALVLSLLTRAGGAARPAAGG
jgi:MFS family permease